MSRVNTSFSADFALCRIERDIALRRLELIKHDLIKLKTESVSFDVSCIVADLLEWFDAPILLDEDFSNVLSSHDD